MHELRQHSAEYTSRDFNSQNARNAAVTDCAIAYKSRKHVCALVTRFASIGLFVVRLKADYSLVIRKKTK